MNRALIFAGGTGKRMGELNVPKQFLLVNEKPIIVHTIEHFQKCKQIDSIVVVCVKDYISHMNSLVDEYKLTKVVSVIEGGDCGQSSIFNGLKELVKLYGKESDDIVLIHDGVRPLIDDDLIKKNIQCVQENGNSVTVSKSVETIAVLKDKFIEHIMERRSCYIAKAPQCFYLQEIYLNHLKAIKDKKFDFVDSATLMQFYGVHLHTVESTEENIKITTMVDYLLFKAILDARGEIK